MSFFWVKDADFLSVSERTLRSKRAKLEISLKYSQIIEMQLGVELQNILTENSNMGEKIVVGALLFRVITMQRKMFHKSANSGDHVEKFLRGLKTLRRRT